MNRGRVLPIQEDEYELKILLALLIKYKERLKDCADNGNVDAVIRWVNTDLFAIQAARQFEESQS